MSFRLAKGLFFRTASRPLYTGVRSLSTQSTSNSSRKFRNIASTTLLVAGATLFLVYYFDSRSAIHRYVFTPILRHTLDAEDSHKFAVKVLKYRLGPKDTGRDDERLAVELWGQHLPNPIGLAAGFDKDGDAIAGLYDLGFGWIEIGSVTPKYQQGNPHPRVFRLLDDSAVINRYGFPSQGHSYVVARLLAWYQSNRGSRRLLSVNLGKNKSSPPDSISDFLTGIRTFAPMVPVLVINVSSPNTPGLRALQARGLLEELLAGAIEERNAVANATGTRARLVLKIAPDLTEEAVADLADVVRNNGIDGVIVSNTTVVRPDSLISPDKYEAGGLSGPAVKPLALHIVRQLRGLLPASIPIIGCGGIASGADALDYARAGASAVQLYTSFTYDGPGTARRIKDEVTQELRNLDTTWADITRDAVIRLSLKGEQPEEPVFQQPLAFTSVGENIRALIQEAEDIEEMLDSFAAKLNGQIENENESSTIPTSDIDTIPPVPPTVMS